MFHASMRVTLALISGIAVTGCDGRTEAESTSPKDQSGAAFEEKLEGCAAVAADFGGKWIGSPYAPLGKLLEGTRVAYISSYRVIRSDMAVTEDYRSDRLNISLDDKDVVTKIYCG